MSATPSFVVSDATNARNAAAHSNELANPSAIGLMSKTNAATLLEPCYQPGCYDVVCGRGKGSYNQPGNKHFRARVTSCVSDYQNVKARPDKSAVLGRIVDKIQSFRDPKTGEYARFVKHSKQAGWVQIGKDEAREKVGHAMREAVMANEPFSSSAKDGPTSLIFPPRLVPGMHNAALTSSSVGRR
jgi:hypothetical protein